MLELDFLEPELLKTALICGAGSKLESPIGSFSAGCTRLFDLEGLSGLGSEAELSLSQVLLSAQRSSHVDR